MSKQSQNLVRKEIRTNERLVRQSEQNASVVRKDEQLVQKYEQAKALLRIGSIPAKTFAFELGCSERFVQQMAALERNVPDYMLDKILTVGNEILWEQKKAIDAHIETLMLMQFGRVE